MQKNMQINFTMKFPAWLRFVFLATLYSLLFQLSGCMSNSVKESSSVDNRMPEWVLRPPGDNVATIYGIGEGRDLESAKQNALKDIAGKLATYIKSESENRDYLINGRGDSTFKQKVNTEIKKMKLSNFEVLQSSQSGHIIYTLVALSRAQFVAGKNDELNELNKQIEGVLQQVGQKNLLVQLQAYSQALALADKARPLIALIQAADLEQDKRRHLADYRTYAQKEQQLLEQSKIYMKPNASMAPVVHHIKGLLQSQGLQVGNRAEADGILEVNGIIQEAEVFSSKSVKIELDLTLSTPTNQTLSRTKYTLTGSSVSSYETGRNNALNVLSKQLGSREALFNLFGANQQQNTSH